MVSKREKCFSYIEYVRSGKVHSITGLQKKKKTKKRKKMNRASTKKKHKQNAKLFYHLFTP